MVRYNLQFVSNAKVKEENRLILLIEFIFLSDIVWIFSYIL